ncbi:unnamed protein product [Leptosia nina]|uniref:Death domain-containing protein n=1 Tax=Leptosia nina TaxID=320188 RepID=A0AAV1ITA2_9NEOP
MTNKLSAKFFEIFRNLKSDAVPRPPRSNSYNENSEDLQNENVNFTNTEDEPKKKSGKKKPKYDKSFSTPEPDPIPNDDEDDRRNSNSSSVVNTQASGNVINIVNASNIRWGNEFTYYLGPVSNPQKTPKTPDEEVEKTNLIKNLMKSEIEPDHDYIDYISKNLGKNWYSIFRSLGYTRGQIETAEIDMAKSGVAEARYKLLLDWVRNDDDGTLGKLARVLWDEDERQVVKELAAIYERNQK